MSNLIRPTGKILGLRERLWRPGEICGFARDRVGLPARRDWPDILADPNRVRMTRYVRHVFDQGSEGSCASESSTGQFAIRRIWESPEEEDTKYNPWFNYHHVKSRGGGSSLDANLRFGRDFGYCPEEIWPRSMGVSKKPSADAYAAALLNCGDEFDEVENEEEGGGLLLCGQPFAFGWKGHSCVATEMIDTEWFWYLNSWDAGWGEEPYPDCPFRGFGRLRLRDIEYERYGAYAHLTTTNAV